MANNHKIQINNDSKVGLFIALTNINFLIKSKVNLQTDNRREPNSLVTISVLTVTNVHDKSTDVSSDQV